MRSSACISLAHATELIAEACVAMQLDRPRKSWAAPCAHPTVSESVMEAAEGVLL
jgi:pyruvate/2-oxoglutarate dehydrogenase complex dihydrolipoamide dehydrogenase (E3) component